MSLLRFLKFTVSRVKEQFEMRRELRACQRSSEILGQMAMPFASPLALARRPLPPEFAAQRKELKKLRFQLELDESLHAQGQANSGLE